MNCKINECTFSSYLKNKSTFSQLNFISSIILNNTKLSNLEVHKSRYNRFQTEVKYGNFITRFIKNLNYKT